VPHLRAAFPGSAVVLGEETYEVVSETETNEGVVYGLRAWPEGEVARARMVYGPRLVHAARAERDRAAAQARARPYRLLLYPLVGLLPEEAQERWADRLGLYAVKATLVSGAAEVVVLLAVIWAIARAADEGLRLVLVLGSPVFLFLALTGFGRAFSAAAFRETRGEYLIEAVYAGWETLRREARAHDPTLVPMTREAFWARLEEPDRVTREKDGALLFQGLLPHLSWHAGHHVRAGEDFWLVERLPPALVRGRLVFGYRLTTPPGRPPHSTAAEPAGEA
jgi:hypothetical protein